MMKNHIFATNLSTNLCCSCQQVDSGQCGVRQAMSFCNKACLGMLLSPRHMGIYTHAWAAAQQRPDSHGPCPILQADAEA